MNCTIAKTTETHNPEVIEDRLGQFTDLGFTVEEAKKLAVARKSKASGGNYWRVQEVQKMLDHPKCDHGLAVDLIT
jgi:hypothetical protein